MSSFSWETSTSTSSTMDYFYNDTLRDHSIKRKKRKLGITKGDPLSPLSHLRKTEENLKDEKDEPSGGMPTELILFDPKELVLGGKNK